MNENLQSVLNFIQKSNLLSEEEKISLVDNLKQADKELTLVKFKWERAEKVKKTTAILLEETIEELDQKRKAVEIQNRELEIESALDRIRVKIASMRTTKDLNRITQVIWNELKTLDVPFFRCGIFIVDEALETIQMYLSKSDGRSIAALNLPIDSSDLTRQAVTFWRKKAIYKEHWDRDDFVQWMQSLIEQKQIESAPLYQGADQAPESHYLHFIPFSQGLLYVGNSNPLSDDNIELVKSVAEAFSVAFSRYEDFKNLEEAKNKIELTLNKLKATQSQLIQSEKMASLGELTAGIAHEIQNPLNFVNNFSEVNKEMLEELNEEIDKGNLSEVKEIAKDVIENESKISHHGKRAESIVKGMLLHSRGSSGKKEPTDINALADEYLRLAYHGFRAKDKSFNADYKLELDESLPKIDVVPEDISRVLLNLINNAFYAVDKRAKEQDPLTLNGGTKNDQIKYLPTVTVSTASLNPPSGGRGVRIVVRDNGPGIPTSIKDKIFQPFFTTKPTGSGTGLGLSLSYDIIRAHGGEIKIETRKGKGTTFILMLSNH